MACSSVNGTSSSSRRTHPGYCAYPALRQQKRKGGDIALAQGELICRMTDADKGAESPGRRFRTRRKSSSDDEIQTSMTRPQRPLRWLADAWETGSIGRRCTLWQSKRLIRAVPGSITYRCPARSMEGFRHVGRPARCARRPAVTAGRRGSARCWTGGRTAAALRYGADPAYSTHRRYREISRSPLIKSKFIAAGAHAPVRQPHQRSPVTGSRSVSSASSTIGR